MMNMAAVLQLLGRTDEALVSLREANRVRGAAALDRRDELRALDKLARQGIRSRAGSLFSYVADRDWMLGLERWRIFAKHHIRLSFLIERLGHRGL